MKSVDRKKRNDLLLILALLLIGGICALILCLTKHDGAVVSVIQDGTETAQYSLSKPKTIVISDTNGGRNTLVIEDGCAKITEADCPDHLCVHQRAISANGETIVCLPHKLVIKVTAGDAPEVDFAA